jgi:hypothetical protein
MSNLSIQQQKHLELLIADFGATKAEIARRSNLQRVVLAAHIGLFAFVGNQLVSHSLTAPLIVGIWFSAALSFQFYTREGLEIRRLGSVIRERIAPIASKMLEVPIQDLLHSQTNSKFPEMNKATSRYNKQFKWVVFFCLPLIVTIFYLSQDWSRFLRILDFHTRGPYMSICVIIAGFYTLRLLKKYAWFEKQA